MSNNSELNPTVYDSENVAGDEKIFRPNVDNLNTDTAESRILTPASDVNYHSIDTRNNKREDPTAQTREAESLRSIIERLDLPERGGDDVVIETQTIDTQESDIRSIITEEYNKVLSTMRVDMVAIIQLLQTLHPKVNEQVDEVDNIKEDIYNLVQAVRSLRDKIEEANTLTLRRQQKYSAKVDDQINKICSRLEALERSNFTTNEPVNREGQRRNVKDTSAKSGSSNTRNANIVKVQKSSSPQSTQEIHEAQSNLKRQNLRVRPKRAKPTKDAIGNNVSGPSAYNSTSRMANRVGKFEDTVEQASVKASRMSSRGLRDSITAKTTRKPQKDVIKSGADGKTKSKSRSRDDNEESDGDEFVEYDDDSADNSETLDTESEDNGKNIQVFKA